MENQLIPITSFCLYHKIKVTFINDLEEYGLIKTKVIKKTTFVHTDDLANLERLVRLHQELNINLEGLHAITHLLNQLENLQMEIAFLKSQKNIH